MSINIQDSVGSGGGNRPDDVRAIKERLVELGFNWLRDEGQIDRVDQLTIGTIKLFQAIKMGLQKLDASLDGRVDVNGDSLRWLGALNAPKWQTMLPGSREEGFVNDELRDKSDDHDFGTNWLAETLRDAGAKYKTDFLDANPGAALLAVNDVSKPRGGDTPDHATHECGLAADIRLPRKDGKAGGGITVAAKTVYDRNAMREMLKAFLAQPLAKRVFLNDSTLIAEGLCSHADGHEDHAHFEIKPPARIDG